MKQSPSPLTELRSEVIFRHVRRMVRETGVSIEDYSEDVLRVWLERTPVGARAADFREAGPVYDRMGSNGQKIRRWMNPEVAARPSVDVEEPLVYALAEPYRADCRRDLARRYALLDVALPAEPENDHVTDIAAMGDVAMEFGELMRSLASILDDGVIDAADAPRVPHAVEECEKLIAKAMVVRLHLQRALPGGAA